ncbi:MAG: hypothetical protein ACFE95_01280 [Candidatus Hodarchaeota archaeon]
MDLRLIGIIMIAVGLFMAGFGGTMSSINQTVFYIVGFVLALTGAGLIFRYYKRAPETI